MAQYLSAVQSMWCEWRAVNKRKGNERENCGRANLFKKKRKISVGGGVRSLSYGSSSWKISVNEFVPHMGFGGRLCRSVAGFVFGATLRRLPCE
ncbi:hypothetical protein NC651_004853 [Populus alba x Populus x berolinensis]|nr:hypothetical protein NC651_004853 [Populus alba x Populus x berolinensis]